MLMLLAGICVSLFILQTLYTGYLSFGSQKCLRRNGRRSPARDTGNNVPHVIVRSTNVRQLNETRAGRSLERLPKRATRKEDFLHAFRVPTRSTRSKCVFTEVANDLRFWAEHGSWAYCMRCGSLQSKKLLPAYRKRTKPTSSTSCTCSAGR